MKKIFALAAAALMGLGMAACSDDGPAADAMAGSYRCNAANITSYTASDGSVRDTTYIGSACDVNVSRVDDNHVLVSINVGQWGWTTLENASVALRDAGTGHLVNLGGDGTLKRAGVSGGYPVSVGGTFNTESKDLVVSLQVKNYSRRTVLSFTTR